MARMPVEVKGLFATPVAAVELPDAASRNDALAQIILARRKAFPSIHASNAGGWHSDQDMLSWGGPRMREVIELAQSVATQMVADRAGNPVAPAWQVRAWANVNGPGDSNLCHYHPGSFWSGTYYVDDGGCAADPALGGEFEMIDPRGPGPGMYAPTLKFAGQDGASVGNAEAIRPKPGLLFLFPSWLQHQVRPYRGSSLRISIAFNLSL